MKICLGTRNAEKLVQNYPKLSKTVQRQSWALPNIFWAALLQRLSDIGGRFGGTLFANICSNLPTDKSKQVWGRNV
jgi:hypothetical protein